MTERTAIAAAAARRCRDEGGHPDDWFVIYCAVRDQGADPEIELAEWRRWRDG